MLTAAYFLRLVRNLCQGDPAEHPAAAFAVDLSRIELITWAPLIALTVLLGVWPGLLLAPLGCPMTMTWTDWQAIAVPLVLAIGAVAVLMIDASGGVRPRSCGILSHPLLTSGVILFGLVFVWAQRDDFKPAFCRPAVEGPAECSLVFEPLTAGLWAVLLIGGLGVVGLSAYQLLLSDIPVGEYHFLLLSALVGATVLAGARDLATMVIGLEVVSLPSFAMVALRRDRRGSEGALKAFLVSVLSTAVMLFGISYLYGVTGSLYLTTIANRLPGLDPDLQPGRVRGRAVRDRRVRASRSPRCRSTAGFRTRTSVRRSRSTAFLAVVSKSAGVAGLLVLVIDRDRAGRVDICVGRRDPRRRDDDRRQPRRVAPGRRRAPARVVVDRSGRLPARTPRGRRRPGRRRRIWRRTSSSRSEPSARSLWSSATARAACSRTTEAWSAPSPVWRPP